MENKLKEHQNIVLACFQSVFHLKAPDEASLCVQFTEQGLSYGRKSDFLVKPVLEVGRNAPVHSTGTSTF